MGCRACYERAGADSRVDIMHGCTRQSEVVGRAHKNLAQVAVPPSSSLQGRRSQVWVERQKRSIWREREGETAGLIRRACWRCALPVRRTGGARSGSGYARREGRTRVRRLAAYGSRPPGRPLVPPHRRAEEAAASSALWLAVGGIALALSRFSAAPRFISRARWVVPLISHAPPPVALFSKPLCWQAGGRPTKSHTHNPRPPAVSSTYGGGR